MPLNLTLDHINVRTTNLQSMLEFYERVMDLRPGPRPHFGGSNGAWLYTPEKTAPSLGAVKEDYRAAWVHFIEVESTTGDTGSLQIEHFAFTASGLGNFLDVLKAENCAYQLAEVPDVGLVQVNFRDPDGNHIHVDFSLDEKTPHPGQ